MTQAIAVVGPTGSGKTALALELAERLETEIISADSMQFYRGMEIGTAAPTVEERARVPHHFVGFLAPDEEMAAGPYGACAREVVDQLHQQGRTAVIVGGSGLYISALIDSLFEGPAKDAGIRKRLHAEAEEQGNAALYARLQDVDPAYAATLSSENDLIRIVRALEVYEISGEPFSKLHRDHQQQAKPLDALQVAIEWPREALYERINLRVDRLVEEGWIDEVERLLAAGHGAQIQRLKALGYREIMAALAGEKGMDEAVEATKMHHRRYAKRQLSWFRGDARIQWVNPDADVAALAERVLTCTMRR